ncbi:hypothetical protein MMC13_007253 [Lambiella insularis]|nr:hypothetical protein [Lambiella insularis]
MDPATIFAFVEFSTETLVAIRQLVDFLRRVKDAPQCVLRWKNEAEILRAVVEAAIKDGKGMIDFVSRETWSSYQEALEAVREHCYDILTLLKESLPDGAKGRRRRILKSLNFVFRENNFKELVAALERAKTLLHLSQMGMANEAQAGNNRMLQQTNNQLHKLSQAIIRHGNPTSVASKFDQLSTEHQVLSVRSTSNAKLREKNMQEVSDTSNPFKAKPNDSLEVQARINYETTSSRTISGSKVKHFTVHNQFGFLKGQTGAVSYHSPWLGTVMVSRRTTAIKEWNVDDQQYEEQKSTVQMSIKVQPAPWLLVRGYEVRLENLIARYGASSLNVALEPISYAPLTTTYAAGTAVKDLQGLLANRKFSTKDRDILSGQNLLEITMTELESDWGWYEVFDQTMFKKRNMIQTARWLVSRGLTYDFRESGPFLNSFMHLGPPDESLNNFEAYELESLLLESTESAPCLPRAKMLLLYALQNPGHSLFLMTTIQDIVIEASVNCSPHIFAIEEEEFWKSEDIFSPGIAFVVLRSMLKLAKVSQPADDKGIYKHESEVALEGPRKILYKMLCVQHELVNDEDDYTGSVANYLILCKVIPFLGNGFGAYTSHIACKHHRLHLWLKALQKASYDPTSSVMKPCFTRQDGSELYFDCLSADNSGPDGLEKYWPKKARSWDDLEQASDFYTEIEHSRVMPDRPEPVKASDSSLMYRLAAEGLSFVLSVV